MKSSRLLTFLLFALFITMSASAYRTSKLFDNAWRFYLGDDSLAATVNYNDTQWRTLDLPHDWDAELPFLQENPTVGGGGYAHAGIGWYRKAFTPTLSAPDNRMLLYFEGAYMNSSVYVNGQLAGGHPYGFNSFYVDITDKIIPGKQNIVAVRCDNSQQPNCRFYTGSGIYRHVWLEERSKDGINDPWKLYIRTEKVFGINADATKADSAIVRISYEGKPDELRTFRNVNLWSPEHPALYNIKVGDLEVEHGFRTIRYNAREGFVLNGKKYLINGACLHSDNGILGSAAFDKAEWRKASLMKEGGFNAVRTAHNPPAPEFLRACDHLGLLVIDEAFDGWRSKKTKYDYHLLLDEWWQKDVDALVLRDRNHPSIICWSNGNEIFERKKLECVTTSRKMANRMRELDPSRPVTNALCGYDKDWEIYDPLAESLDIVGYNYLIQYAADDMKRVPDRVCWQTESYIKEAFPNWRHTVEEPYVIGDFIWTALDYLGESGIGGWRYEGEPQGEHWEADHYPWHGAYCGDIDITGWRKPISYYRDMLWNGEADDIATKKPAMLKLAVKEPSGYYGKIIETLWCVWPTWESWNWPGHEGKSIDVDIYSRYPKVRLYLNDRLIAERATTFAEEYKATITLDYAPGTLRAVGVKADGTEDVASTQILRTAGEPAQLRLTPTAKTMTADGQDIVWVTVEVLDKQGNPCPNAENLLTFSVSGAAALQAKGSANMKDATSYAGSEHKAWKGRAIAALRSTHKSGKATLTVTSPKLKAAKVTVTVK